MQRPSFSPALKSTKPKRQPYQPSILQKVCNQYFKDPRQPGDVFWSVREIAARFQLPRHSAEKVVRELTRQGVIETRGRQGCFLAVHPDVHLGIIEKLKLAPAFVGPGWVHEERPGSLPVDLTNALLQLCRQRGYPISFIEPGDAWGNSGFVHQLRIMRCNTLIAMNPAPESFIELHDLRRADFQVVVIGDTGVLHERDGIVSVNADEFDAARRVTLQWRGRGLKRILVAGRSSDNSHRLRRQGIEAALDQFDHKPTGDMFIETFDEIHMCRVLAGRLAKKPGPQAVLFHNHTQYAAAVEHIPDLHRRATEGLALAVFDESRADLISPDLPLTRLVIDGKEIATKAIELAELLLRERKPKLRHFVPRKILSPAGKG